MRTRDRIPLLARTKLGRASWLAALAAFAIAAVPASASAATLVVDDDFLAAVGDCDALTVAHSTISAAVAAATAGDTIQVCEGTYNEGVAVDKSLTINGPNVGTSALDTRVAEATVTSTGTTMNVTSADVTIDGFTISGDFGVYANTPTASGFRFLNNIVSGTSRAISADAPGTGIDIIGNDVSSPTRHIHLSGATPGFEDVAVNENRFTGNGTIFYSGNTSIEGYEFKDNEVQNSSNNMASRISDGEVSGNTFESSVAGSLTLQIDLHDSTVSGNTWDGNETSRCLQLYGVQFGLDPSTNVTVTDETFTDCGGPVTPAGSQWALQLSEGIDEIDITGNDFVSTTGDAINTRTAAGWTLNPDIHINQNNITGSSQYGVNNTVSGTLDIECNWWGAADGPGPSGAGDDVNGDVDFTPWLIAAAPGGACTGAPNSPPTADAGGPYTINEGQGVALNGTGTDPDSGDVLTYTWDVNGDATYGDATGEDPTLTGAQLAALGLGDGPDSANVKVKVSDGTVTTESAATTLTVNNVPPVCSIDGPNTAKVNTSTAFTFGASDPGDSAFTYTIDWGHGGSPQVVSGDGSEPVSHSFPVPGVNIIKASANDGDGGTCPQVSKEVWISGAALITDPVDGSKTALVVAGTKVKDTIVVRSLGGGSYDALVNGVSTGPFSPTGQIIVLGGTGDDTISVQAAVALRTILQGGGGADTITAGNQPTILVGNSEADKLNGGPARDVLIGGTELDTLVGNGNDDALSTGRSGHDWDYNGLARVRDTWARTDINYATRVSMLLNASGGAPRFKPFSPSQNVFDDTSADSASGNAGQDWFLANRSGGTALDNLPDRAAATETLSEMG